MPNAILSVWKPLKPIALMIGLATVLAACNVHDSGRRGPVHYSERHHWNDGDRHRRDRHEWRHDRRGEDWDRYRHRRYRQDR